MIASTKALLTTISLVRQRQLVGRDSTKELSLRRFRRRNNAPVIGAANRRAPRLGTCRAGVVHSGGDGIEQLACWKFKLFDCVDRLSIFLGIAVPKLCVRFMQEPYVALHGRTQHRPLLVARVSNSLMLCPTALALSSFDVAPWWKT